MEKPELEAEAAAALAAGGNTEGTPEGSQDIVTITNENALIVMAQALIGIEKHLLALVYIENTKDSDKSGVTYLPEVFAAIYDGGDPFKEVQEALKKAAAMETPDA